MIIFNNFAAMGFNLTDRDRKIIGVALSILASISIIITFTVSRLGNTAEVVMPLLVRPHTPLAQDIISIERAHPTLSVILFGLLCCATMVYLTLFTTRRTLYPLGTVLQPVIFTSLLLAVASLTPHPLLACVTLILAVCGTTEIYSTNHASSIASIYSDTPNTSKSPISRLFIGALYFGIMSLIHPSAFILIVIFPIAIFCFDRYLHELITPLIAFFIPMAVEIYLRWWLCDANVNLLIDRYIELVEPAGSLLCTWQTFVDRIQLSYAVSFLVIFSLLLSVLGLTRILNYSITARAHQRFVFSVALFILGIILTMLSSFSYEMLIIIATPVAILITAALINLRTWISLIIYSLYVAITFCAILQ